MKRRDPGEREPVGIGQPPFTHRQNRQGQPVKLALQAGQFFPLEAGFGQRAPLRFAVAGRVLEGYGEFFTHRDQTLPYALRRGKAMRQAAMTKNNPKMTDRTRRGSRWATTAPSGAKSEDKGATIKTPARLTKPRL